MKKLILIVALLSASNLSYASVVKMSNSKICHSPESSYYDTVKRFTSYTTLNACLSDGGRLPKGKKHTSSSSLIRKKYKREYFGHGWADFDKDCQNARMEALIAQSTTAVKFKTDKQCKVKHGRWISPFTGNVITNASLIDIDHVVPLKWAWERGANQWSKKQRIRFANDPINLWSVERELNRSKGAKGINQWLPPKNQCQYIVRFERIRKSYQLEIKPNEKRAYQKKLTSCL
jgi:hypothetical protein